MAFDFLRSGNNRHTAQRVLAVLLLSLSFVDLAVIDLFLPELCAREGAMVAAAKAATAVGEVKSGLQPISGAADTQPQDSSTPVPFEDDCFCCCAHILPSAYFSFPALRFQAEQGISQIDFLPSAPPLETFHPPRIA